MLFQVSVKYRKAKFSFFNKKIFFRTKKKYKFEQNKNTQSQKK